MAAPLRNLQDRFEPLATDSVDRDAEHGQLTRDLDLNGVCHVSREEDRMLRFGNLFAAVVFGASGEYRERGIR